MNGIIKVGDIEFEDWTDNSRSSHEAPGSVRRKVINGYQSDAIYIDVFLDKIIASVFPGTSDIVAIENYLSSAGLLEHYSIEQYTVSDIQDKIDNALMKMEKMMAFV
jgi:hypothetical protein